MVHMDITPYVDRLRADLTAAAAAGGEPVRDAAERLSLALDPAMRLGLMEVLSEAAAEITSAMRTGSVETRLAGRDIEFVLDQSATTAPPTEDTATTETDEGEEDEMAAHGGSLSERRKRQQARHRARSRRVRGKAPLPIRSRES